MIFEMIIFILGLAVLVKGSDIFVKAASSIAKRLGVSGFIIGLTVVALGTSFPELITSIIASVFKDSGLVVGNIVGSNIANMGLIVGLVASFYLIKTKKAMIKRDGYFMLFASVLFFLFVLDSTINRSEGLVFIFFYLIYMFFLFEEKPKEHIGAFITYFFRLKYLTTIRSRVFYKNHEKKIKQKKKIKQIWEIGLLRDFFILALSGVAVVLGANSMVKEAIYFAQLFNVPSNIIGISLIALGTSLPELMVSLTAARKGYGEIAVGNIIGSNIANIFLVGGIAALINPLEIIRSTIYLTVPFMIGMSVLLLIFLKTQWRIKRWEGMILLFLYILLMVFLFMGVIY